ncbi:MAG TPA: hypothetical protein PKM88_10495, partial [bacterium]|nr:hypothetical protein [bacterium]
MMAGPVTAASTFSFSDTFSLKLYRGTDTTPGTEVRTLYPGETMTVLAMGAVFDPDSATFEQLKFIDRVQFFFIYGALADSGSASNTRHKMSITGVQSAAQGDWTIDTAAEAGSWQVYNTLCTLPPNSSSDRTWTIISCVFTPGRLATYATGAADDSWTIAVYGCDKNGNNLAGGRTYLDTQSLACAFAASVTPAATTLQFDTGTAAAHLDLRPRLPADSLPLTVIANADYDIWMRTDSLAGCAGNDTLWFSPMSRTFLTISDAAGDTALAARALTGVWRGWSPLRGYAAMQDSSGLGDTWNLHWWLDYPDSGGFDRFSARTQLWIARRGAGDTMTGSDSCILTVAGATRRLQASDLVLNSLTDTWLSPADSTAVVLDLQVPGDWGAATTLRGLRLHNVAATAIGGDDIDTIALWRDGGAAGWQGSGSDSFCGCLYDLGGGVRGNDTLAVPVPAGGVRLFAVMQLSATARGDSDFLTLVPVDGLRLGVNRGPADTGCWRPDDTRLRMDFTPPVPPTGLIPPAGIDTAAARPPLSWNAAGDTQSGLAQYLVQFDTNAAFTSPRTETTAATNLTPAVDLYSCTWYWRVLARDAVGNAAASATAWLRVDTVPPTVPVLTSPAAGAELCDTHPLLQYSATDAITGVAAYRVQLDTVATFTSPLTYDTSAVVMQVDAQLSYDTWYWRVRATDTLGNQSNWSATRALVVTDTVSIRLLAGGADTTVVQAGTLLELVVLARAANRSATAVDALVVTGSSARTGDTCRLVVQESGVNTATFSFTGLLLSDSYAGADSVAMVAVGDVLTVQHSNGSAAVTLARRMTAGSVRLTDAAFADTTGCRLPGPLYVEVQDSDRNFNPHLRDSFTVSMYNAVRADTEVALVTETGDTSCVFRSIGLPVSDTHGSAVNDGWLLAAGRDTVSARYTDTGSGETAEESVVAWRVPSTCTVRLTTAGFADTTLVYAGTAVYAEIGDGDANRDPRQRDTVTLAWGTGTDSEDTLAVETTDTSGLFRLTAGLFVTARAAGASAVNDGNLYLPAPAMLSLRYADPTTAGDSGTDSASSQWTAAMAAITSSAYADTSMAYAPGRLHLQVTDGNANGRRNVADTVLVTVATLVNGDSELVVAGETGDSTGIFRATFWLSDTYGRAWASGILMAEIRDTVTLAYADPYDAGDTKFDSVPLRRYPANGSLQFVTETLA